MFCPIFIRMKKPFNKIGISCLCRKLSFISVVRPETIKITPDSNTFIPRLSLTSIYSRLLKYLAASPVAHSKHTFLSWKSIDASCLMPSSLNTFLRRTLFFMVSASGTFSTFVEVTPTPFYRLIFAASIASPCIPSVTHRLRPSFLN